MSAAIKTWEVRANGYLEPRIGTDGPAARPPKTVMQLFRETVAAHGDRPALCQKRPAAGQKPEDVEWTTWTWRQYYDDVNKFAKTLLHIGFGAHHAVNIIGFNSPAWFISNVGTIFAGGIAAGIYSTNIPSACKYITEHSEAEVVVVEDRKQLEKYLPFVNELPHLKAFVIYGEEKPQGAAGHVPVYNWEEFLELGAQVPDATLEERIKPQLPGHCNTLIYTSGTTGPPKAVMITHDNVTWTIATLVAQFPDLGANERIISYLPLSHIAAQILDIYGTMHLGAAVYFAQADALRGSLGRTMKEVRPTVFLGVPRVWEKIYEKMQEVGAQTRGLKKKIATWAKARGTAHSQLRQFGNPGGNPCGFGCANSLVLSKVKDALGLNQCRVCVTGAAPISMDVLNYFASLDIPIYELFGQSECTGPHSVNDYTAWKIGTVGRPLPGTETKIDPNNGELCYRGRHIFMGYMKMEEETAKTIDAEGWLHSGDVATLDSDNFLRITGRIKELIITAGGENVPPVLIEDEFKKQIPALSNCMAIGDRRKFLIILFTLKVEIDEATGLPTNRLTGDALVTSRKIASTAATV